MAQLVLKLMQNRRVRGMQRDEDDWFAGFDYVTVLCEYKDTGATARKEFKRLTDEGSPHREEV